MGHDLTQVIPGEFKGPILRKGHIIREEDIPILLATGNDFIYVLEMEEGEVHEDDAAVRIGRAVAGEHLEITPPREGKVSIKTKKRGLLRVKRDMVDRINYLGRVILSTVHDYTPCEAERVIAATRVIPLTVSEEEVQEVERLCEGRKPLELLPYPSKRVGVVITGNEIFYGRVPERFDETVGKKVTLYGGKVTEKLLSPDEPEEIAKAILTLKERGVEIILTTGGLSVDPGDRTLEGVETVSYTHLTLPTKA